MTQQISSASGLPKRTRPNRTLQKMINAIQHRSSSQLAKIHEMQTTINSFVSFQLPIFFSWLTINLNSQPFLPNNISFVYPPRSFHLKGLHSSIPPKHISWLNDKILIETRVQCTAQTSHFSCRVEVSQQVVTLSITTAHPAITFLSC